MTVRRVVGGAVLVGVVVGLPALIGLTGGGPPTGLPWPSQVGHALTRPLTDHDIVRTVAVLAWLLWALFALAVAAEVVARFRHRPSPGETGTGLRIPGLQGLAAALVVTVLLAQPARVGHRPSGPSGPARGRPVPALVMSAALETPTTSLAAGAPPATAGYLPYTVVRYDSPWAIAEAHLGNGLRWKEILTAQGTTLVDGTETVPTPSGPAVEDTAQTIYPGQVLLLPPDATGLAAPPPSTPAPPPAPTAPPIPPEATPSATAPAAPAPAGPAEPPKVVWTGHLGADDAVARPSTALPLDLASVTRAAPDPGPLHSEVPVSDLLLGGAFVASAGLNVLALRRARQSARARRGETPAPPSGPGRAAEQRLRSVADPGPVARVQRALGSLQASLERAHRPPPEVEVVLVRPDSVELVLGRPDVAPPPAEGSGTRWRIPAASIVDDGDVGADAYPCLVPVGRHQATGDHVLFNLDVAPVTEILGDEVPARALLHGVALALAGLPWARGTDVVLVGFGHMLARCRSHVRTADTVRELAGELRAASVPGAIDPTLTLLLVGPTPDAEEVALLRDVCRTDTALRAVLVGDVGVPVALELTDRGLRVPEVDGPVVPAGLSDVEVAGIDDLLQAALAAPVTRPPAEDVEPDGPILDQVAPLEIQVLGSIEIEDLATPFRRPQAKEVLIYLAMHRTGVAEHQLDGAVWPERPAVKPSTRDPVVSAARSAAGGVTRLPFASGQGPDKRYRITGEVGTDWDRFRRLHHLGRAEHRAGPLLRGLELVRGRPFADVLAGPGFGWLHLEGHLHHLEAEIVDAADLAVELLLDAGDPRRARWAANQGLRASPYTERLWVRLMAVADALGEAREVERILAEMDRRLDLEGDFSQLHPETLAAYRRYSRRSSVSAQPGWRPGPAPG